MGKPAFDPSKPFDPVSEPSAGQKPPFDPTKEFSPVSPPATMDTSKAAVIQGENGATLGLRPVVAGLGAAAGDLSGQWDNIKNGKGLNLKQTKDAFLQARQDANSEQNQAQQDHPYISTAANVGGSLLTLPFLPAKGLSGAVKLGAGLGAAQAAGSANSLKEAGIDTVGGAALGAAGYGLAKGITKGADQIANSDIVQGAINKVKTGLSKTASAFTGVPDKEIETYATQYDRVQDLINKSGGNPSVAAEIQKENIQNAVKTTKNNLNSQISEALQNSPQDKSIDINPVLNKMQAYSDRINSSLNPEAKNQIQELSKRIVGASQNGKVSVQDLQQIKQFLGDSAASAFNQSSLGFEMGPEASNAARHGYMEAKNLMDQFGPEEIKNANRQLFQLHKIEDRINKNLIIPGKSDAALLAVGGGAQNRDSLALQRLGDLSGKDFVGDANVLSAYNRFNNPSFSPAYGAGKALFSSGFGAATGALLDPEQRARGAAIGGAIGGALSSPAALKLAIDTGRVSGEMIAGLAQRFGATPSQVLSAIQTPQGQQVILRALETNNKAAASTKPSNVIKTRSQLGL